MVNLVGEQCRKISAYLFIGGIILSAFISYFSGVSLITGQRNWILTIVIFIVCTLFSYLTYLIFAAIGEVITLLQDISNGQDEQLKHLEANNNIVE